jgi:hypothetical protein
MVAPPVGAAGKTLGRAADLTAFGEPRPITESGAAFDPAGLA